MPAQTKSLSLALLLSSMLSACSAPTQLRQPTVVAPSLVATQLSLGWPAITLSTLQKTDDSIAVTTSNQHDAGVWLAANAAAKVQQQPLADFRWKAISNAEFNSVAASGALTIGFVASIRHVELDANAAVLGVLFPDGTLGPSEELVANCAAALAAGKLRIGYPQSTPAKKLAELTAMVQTHGNKPTLVALADVYDGYRLLTGSTLSVPTPVLETALALDDPTVTALRSDFNLWRQRTLTVWPEVIELTAAGRLPTQLLHSAVHTQNLLRQATQLAQQGQPAAAQLRMMQTAWHAQAVAASYRVLQHMRSGDLAAATEVLRQQRRTANDGLAVLLDVAGRAVPAPTLAATLSGHAGLALALTAWHAQTAAAERTDAAQRALLNLHSGPRPAKPGSPIFDDEVIATVLPVLLAELQASGLAEQAQATLALPPPTHARTDSTLPTLPTGATLRRWARGFAATAAATRRHLAPSQLVAIAAQPAVLATDIMLHLDATPALVAMRERNPMVDFTASQLAASNTAALYALVALGVHWADDGTVASVDHNDSLDIVVQHAQVMARRNAATTLRITGTIATPCKQAYARAVGLQREGSVASRVAALEAYWQTSDCMRTATMVGTSQASPVSPVSPAP